MIKIYVLNKPLILTSELSPEMKEFSNKPGTVFINDLNETAIKTGLKEMEEPTIFAGIFLHNDLAELFHAISSELTTIKAAGGFVHTKTNEALLIFRRGKWDLPKGKLDEGETLGECAVREVKEETGIENVKLIQPLQVTYHTYYEQGKHILKESHWFLMETDIASSVLPQTEEDIEKCEWIPFENLSSYTGNMHASIVDVIKEGRQAVAT